MSKLWTAQVSQIGADAGEMIEAGVLILFGDPVPEALTEVSIVHTSATELVRPIAAGDRFRIGGREYRIVEIGGRACDNLTELGHVVIYVNQPAQELLPGAIKATGPELVSPAAGDEIEFYEA